MAIRSDSSEARTQSTTSDFFQTRTWIPLTHHEGYDITQDEPFQIRKRKPKGDYKLINQNLNQKLGYYYVKLEKNVPLHRVICEQFIPNPDNLPQTDHKNRDKTDNRLLNLRWVSVSVNACNKTRIRGVEQLFIDTLPEGYVPFTEYIVRPERKDPLTGEIIPADVRKLPDLYVKWEVEYEDDGTQHWTPQFITFDSKHQYRKLSIDKHNKNCVKTRDENHKVTSITFSKIQKPEPKTENENLIVDDAEE
jgi:hypothetical protein